MNADAYNDWTSLFEEDVVKIWEKETMELKKASMIVFILKREFERVQNSIDDKMDTFRKTLCVTPLDERGNQSSNKENIHDDANAFSPTIDLCSPDLFRARNFTSPNIMIKKNEFNIDEQVPLQCGDSPKINKYIDSKRGKIKKRNSTSSKFFLSTPPRTDDSTLVESTPELFPPRKIKSNYVFGKKKSPKFIKSKDNSVKYNTLTQIYGGKAKDDNATLLSECSEDNHSTSSMNIDEILDHIDKKTDKAYQNTDDDDKTFLECGLMRFTGIPRTEDKKPAGQFKQETPKHKNDSPTYAYKPEVVRGKARKQLPGWSCKECKEYYEALGLPSNEIQKRMNECSKHRGKFAPITDTPPGFWDLTMPDSQD